MKFQYMEAELGGKEDPELPAWQTAEDDEL